MKTFQSILFALIFVSQSLFAQDDAYVNAMKSALAEMETAESPDAMLAAANTFQRISQKAEDEYLPHYYAALNILNANWAIQNPKERDEMIDRAMVEVKKAAEIAPGNDEVEVLNGYALMAKMTVDPANRGQSYSPRIYQSNGKALSINPQNPRALIMMAQMEQGTAQFMGTETTKACEMARQGYEILKNTKNEDPLLPSWGEGSAQHVLSSCGG
jgi:hypothetical protein